jgi:ABC-type Fe3+-citrate transport system substrate-binding protein
MTREELAKIILSTVHMDLTHKTGYRMAYEASDEILAALDKEREGEERLHDMRSGDKLFMSCCDDEGEFKAPTKGSIFFRPTKEDR